MVVDLTRDRCTIVRVSGEIDLSNVAELESALDEARTESPRGFVVDVSKASYIDGTAVQAILRVWDRVQGDGTVAVVTGDTLPAVFEAVGLDALPHLVLCNSISDAADAISCSMD